MAGKGGTTPCLSRLQGLLCKSRGKAATSVAATATTYPGILGSCRVLLRGHSPMEPVVLVARAKQALLSPTLGPEMRKKVMLEGALMHLSSCFSRHLSSCCLRWGDFGPSLVNPPYSRQRKQLERRLGKQRKKSIRRKPPPMIFWFSIFLAISQSASGEAKL